MLHCEAGKASCSQTVRASLITRIASKHAGLRGLWLQEALEDGKLELEKVDTAMNPADVCTKALRGNRIRELCRLARVYVCYSEVTMGDDPNEWYLSWLDESCRCEKFEYRAATLSLKGRVDFTCLNCFCQTHFASAVGHEFVDPKCRTRSIMEKGFM